jgi:DNA polymerase-3 subunit beta
MKLSIPRSELKEALAGLAKVVNARANLPILACVRLEADGKSATLAGTDLSQVATYAIKCGEPASSPVSALIPLESLQTLLKTTDGPAVGIEVGQDEVTLAGTASGQSISRRVDMPDLKDWPALPAPAAMKPVAAQFLDHLRQAAVFASGDDSRPLLKAVFLDVRDKDCHKVVATDSRRLTALNSVRLPLSESAIVPVTRFLTWGKLAGSPCIGADGKSFTLNVGPWTHTTKVVEGQYPNYRQVVPSYDDARTLELSPEDSELLIKALPCLPAYEGGQDAVVLCLEMNSMRVFSRADAKSPESSIRLESSKQTGKGAFSIGLDRRFFREALIAGFRLWEMRDPTSPLLGRLSKEDKGSLHVLMPIRTIDHEVQRIKAPVPSTPPVSVPVQPTTPKEPPMPKKIEVPQTVPAEAPSSLDRILAAYDAARDAVRQAQSALADVAQCVRDAIKDDRARRKEIADVRAGLARLQAIRV